MFLNKIDLLPHVPFRADVARDNARAIRPDIEIIEVSCITGAGFKRRLEWLAARADKKKVSATRAVAESCVAV
jgi:hydrogenase nickel incorporation protein HypB